MRLFGKKSKTLTPPGGMGADSIEVETSTCTGEKTIGFYDPHAKRLLCAELVTSDEDIVAFYEKYGLSPEK